MPQLIPVGDRILVQREKVQEVTPGGIHLPTASKEKPCRGTVVAVGEGRQFEYGGRTDFQVRVGDTVLFASYAGVDLPGHNGELTVMREDDVLALER